MTSILAKVRPSDVRNEPFPHVVIEGALPPFEYAQLSALYPHLHFFTGGAHTAGNKVINRSAKVLSRQTIPEPWREHIDYHTSSKFYLDVLRVFLAHAHELHPSVPWSKLRTGIRGLDTYGPEMDLGMDALFWINTPVRDHPSSVRGRHLDDPKKLYNGLLYFRHPDDDLAEGGDFIIWEQIGRKQWREHTVVPYRANTLIFFLNTPNAWHGVRPREVSNLPRRAIAYVGELGYPLFDEKKTKKELRT